MTCVRIKGPGRQRTMLCTPDGPLAIPGPDCPNAEQHTPCPSGYIAWHEWAESMAQTHEPRLCEGCDKWMIWAPKERPDA